MPRPLQGQLDSDVEGARDCIKTEGIADDRHPLKGVVKPISRQEIILVITYQEQIGDEEGDPREHRVDKGGELPPWDLRRDYNDVRVEDGLMGNCGPHLCEFMPGP